MKLNGWQRLWVVVAVVWILPVLAMSYELWPPTADVTNAEVYARMKPEDTHRFVDYDPDAATVAAIAAGATRLQPEVPPSPAPTGTIFDQLAAREAAENQAQLAFVDGHELKIFAGVSREDMSRIVSDYNASLRHILALKRAVFVGEAFAGWIVPAVALYALGSAVGWIRRGFGANRFDGAG